MSTGTESAPRSLADLNKIIKHDLTPDPSWTPTGEFHRDTGGNVFPVYSETIELTERRQDKDADGRPLYHFHPDGSPDRRRPAMISIVTGTIEREFVLMPVGTGQTEKNYNFRPAPGEIERARNVKEETEGLSMLGRALREGGIRITDVIDAIKGRVGVAPDAPPTPVAPVEPPADSTPPPPAPMDGPKSYPATGPIASSFYLNLEHFRAVQAGTQVPFVGSYKNAKAEMERLAAEAEA